MHRLLRLFAFVREHQEQARAAGDELRVELWNDILDRLLEVASIATQ